MNRHYAAITVLTAFFAFGCQQEHGSGSSYALLPTHGAPETPGPVLASFTPPGIDSLVDIDTTDTSYSEESVVIEGVVSQASQGGWSGETAGYKVHHFTLAAWHCDGDASMRRELTILRPIPPDIDYFDDFPAYSIQRIRVLLSRDKTRAIVDTILPVDTPDEQLQAIAAELQKPVVFSTDQFGDLVLDRDINWFETATQWNGQMIRLTIAAHDDTPDINALKAAELLWSRRTSWENRIEQYAVNELLELKNDTWLQDGQSEFTAKQFIATMALTSIHITSDGEFEFWYDDGDLFWGHAIMVRGNLTDGPIDAGIHG